TQKGYEAVPTWRPSTTGRELGKRHRNLKIVMDGIRDFGADQGYTPLDLVMIACDCDLDTAFRFLSERLGWASDFDRSALRPPADKAAAELAAGAAAKPKAPIDELTRFITVPGVVGEIVDWIVTTSRRPNRVLALGAAITVVGTLIGRRAAGPTRSATHLYAVGIAPTGSGKQHLLDSVIRLMEAANASNHCGPSKCFSLSAVLDLLSSKPRCCARRTRSESSSGPSPAGRQPATSRPSARSCGDCGEPLSPACRRPPGRSARCSSSRVRRCRSSASRRRRNSTPRCRARAPSTAFSLVSLPWAATLESWMVIRNPTRAACPAP